VHIYSCFLPQWARLLNGNRRLPFILFADDYRLLFGDQGKQTSAFHLCFQQKKGSLPFPFSVFSKQMEVAVFCSSVICI
jgi:hypothetical protein